MAKALNFSIATAALILRAAACDIHKHHLRPLTPTAGSSQAATKSTEAQPLPGDSQPASRGTDALCEHVSQHVVQETSPKRPTVRGQ